MAVAMLLLWYFSPDGKLLASVGGDPDYMLTLWDWKSEQTVLRSKAFSQDVFRVSFSSDLEGQLTSSGTGHIRYYLVESEKSVRLSFSLSNIQTTNVLLDFGRWRTHSLASNFRDSWESLVKLRYRILKAILSYPMER